MINNEHVLSGNQDRWFLQQNRTEGVTGNTFQAGDHIVVCGKCKRVWFVDCWNVKGRCPSPDCRSQETRPFEKNIFTLKNTERLRINFGQEQTVKTAPVKKVRTRKVSHPGLTDIWNRVSHTCYRILPNIKYALIGAAITLTVLQMVFPTSVINGKPATYYRTEIAGKFQKAGESFSDNLSDIGTSVGDLFLKVRTSAGNGAADTVSFGVKIRQSAADGMDKILYHSQEFLKHND